MSWHHHAKFAGSAAAAGFCALGLASLWTTINTPGPTPEQVRIETDLRLSQEQRQAKIDAMNAKLDSEWHFDRPTTWLRLVEDGVLFAVFVAAAGSPAALGWHLWNRRDMPDKLTGAVAYRGSLSAQDRISVNAVAMQTRHLLATNPALPSGLQHLHTVHSPRITGPTALSAPPPLTITRIPDVPPFGRLIAAGEVGGNRPLLFGYAETGDKRHEGREHFSIGFAGQPNFGKSNSAGVVLAQHILHGAAAVVCDLQAGNERSLASRLAPLEQAGLFLIPTADSPKTILAAVRTVHGELKAREARQARWRKENGPGTPAPRNQLLVLCIDEWPTVLRGELAEELPPMLADIHDSGPKMDVITELMAQQWGTNVVGGAMVRNSVPAAIIHCCRAEEARMASGLTAGAIPGDTMALGQGEAYMVAPGVMPVRITVPRLEAADLVEVARMAAAQRGNGAGGNRLENPFLGAITPPKTLFLDAPARDVENGESDLVSAVSRAGARARVGDALADQIIALFIEGRKIPAIAKALYPPKVGQERLTGPAYYKATDEVTEVIHEWSMAREQPALTVTRIESPAGYSGEEEDR